MTLVIEPDYQVSMSTLIQQRIQVARHLRAVASSALKLRPDQIDIREIVPGGSGVTSAQTGINVTNFPTGSTQTAAAVDLLMASSSSGTRGTTFVGWLEQAVGITGDTLSNFLAQTLTPIGKVYSFYGLSDLTPRGDMSVLRFTSGVNKVKAYFEVEAIYESNANNLIGGHFVDSDTGDIATVDFGASENEPIGIQGIWATATDKQVKLKGLVAERSQTTVTEAPSVSVRI
jgi:hypothetical protein